MPCKKKLLLISPCFSDYIQTIMPHNHLLFLHVAPLNWQSKSAQVLPNLFSASEVSVLFVQFSFSRPAPLTTSIAQLNSSIIRLYRKACKSIWAGLSTTCLWDTEWKMSPAGSQAADKGGKQKQSSKWCTVPEVMYSEGKKKGKSNREMCLPRLLTLFQLITKKGKPPIWYTAVKSVSPVCLSEKNLLIILSTK